MPTHNASSPLPRGVLLGAGLLIGFALVSVTTARLLHWQESVVPVSREVASLRLNFIDGTDGTVEIRDAAHGGVLVARLATSANGFLRGVVRGLARMRESNDIGPAAPFVLTRWADGRLTLSDPATGERIPLEAFGSKNSRAFAVLFAADESALAAASHPTQRPTPGKEP
jgi:putative photosynthetic complex assembly protein